MSKQENVVPWRGLKLPFYVVLQDKSQAKLKSQTVGDASDHATSNEFISLDYDSILSLRDDSAVEDSGLFEKPINIYPEIRYKFSDDAEDATNEEILNNSTNSNPGPEELSADDTVIVFDFDKTGENIINFKCLSNSWQMYHVNKFKNSQISLEGPNNRQNTTNIIAKGTHCNVDLGENLDPVADSDTTKDDFANSVENIRNMVRLFNERNKQLEQMINLPGLLPR